MNKRTSAHRGPAEPAINALLARMLAAEHALRVQAETVARNGRIPDIRVDLPRHGTSNVYWTAIECKKGDTVPQQRAAQDQATEWLRDAYCDNAFACCYPSPVSNATDVAACEAALATTNDLWFAPMHSDPTIQPEWRSGSLADLAQAIRTTEVSGGAKIARRMHDAIDQWKDGLHDATLERLATLLPPHTPEQAAAVAGIFLIDMLMLHEQLVDSAKGSSLAQLLLPPEELAINARNGHGALHASLAKQWQIIRSVDYAPITDPALLILTALRAPSAQEPLHILLAAARDCAPLLTSDQLDFAGPVYHGLLHSSTDGSFYTTTATAVLLANLAVPDNWCNWADWRDIARRRICDPACGTGTLLMAVQNVLINRLRNGGGSEDDVRKLQRHLIETGLTGLDINRHAIHLSACMLTLAANQQQYRHMQLHLLQHGTRDEITLAGSLELLLGTQQPLPHLGFEVTAEQQQAAGIAERELHETICAGTQDLIIMNPPYTRSNIHHDHLGRAEERRVQEREKEIAEDAPPQYARAIKRNSAGTYFNPIAHVLGRSDDHVYATVAPYTFCMGYVGRPGRDFLARHYNVQCVITNHDNSNFAFSGNTSIHETLIVGRTRKTGQRAAPTHFISLTRNPRSTLDAAYLAATIRSAMDEPKKGNEILGDYGTMHTVPAAQLKKAIEWNWAAFVHQSLADEYQSMLVNHPDCAPLGQFAEVGPDPRAMAGVFKQGAPLTPPKMWCIMPCGTTKLTGKRRSKPHQTMPSYLKKRIKPRSYGKNVAVSL